MVKDLPDNEGDIVLTPGPGRSQMSWAMCLGPTTKSSPNSINRDSLRTAMKTSVAND